MEGIKKEEWYCWREYVTVEGETEPRLVIPWSDSSRYEFPMDLLFETPEKALETKRDFGGEEEDWVLCKMTLEPVQRVRPEEA